MELDNFSFFNHKTFMPLHLLMMEFNQMPNSSKILINIREGQTEAPISDEDLIKIWQWANPGRDCPKDLIQKGNFKTACFSADDIFGPGIPVSDIDVEGYDPYGDLPDGAKTVMVSYTGAGGNEMGKKEMNRFLTDGCLRGSIFRLKGNGFHVRGANANQTLTGPFGNIPRIEPCSIWTNPKAVKAYLGSLDSGEPFSSEQYIGGPLGTLCDHGHDHHSHL